ncbi:MAG: RNA polymerase sigma factor [Saprospiraceae bacterium]|nr:RNA polymerase sigma factor [Saprospiraceae bacterium]
MALNLPGQLLVALRVRNEKAFFTILFEAYTDKLKAFVIKNFPNLSWRHLRPEDIVQEVWKKVCSRGLEQFSEAKIPTIESYLFTIARNKCLNYYKTDHPIEDLDVVKSLPSPENIDYSDDKPDLSNLLHQIPEIQKTIFEMTLDGYKIKEIAETLSMTESNIKYHLGEAKRKLRDLYCRGDSSS